MPEAQVPEKEALDPRQPLLVVAEMLGRQFEPAAHHAPALGDRRVPGASLLQLLEDPGLDQGAAGGDDAADRGLAQPEFAVPDGQDVAVAQHGRVDGRGDRADHFPVGVAAVALLTGAAVHAQGVGAGLDGQQGRLLGVDLLFGPAGAQLHQQGPVDGRAHHLDDARQPARPLEQGGAGAAADDDVDGTAEVQVDVLGAVVDGDARRLGHHLGILAGDLDAEGRLVGVVAQQGQLGAAALDQLVGQDHLAAGQVGAEFPAEPAVGQIPPRGHRGQGDDVAEEGTAVRSHASVLSGRGRSRPLAGAAGASRGSRSRTGSQPPSSMAPSS